MYSDLIIFILLKIIPKKIYIVVTSIISVLFYAMMIAFYQSSIEVWEYKYIFYIPLWRGIAAMLVGTNLFYLSKKIASVSGHLFFRIAEVISFLSIVALCFINVPFHDYVEIFLFIILLISSNSEKSVFDIIGKKKPVRFLCKYQYPMFLNHAWVILVVRQVLLKLSIENTAIKIAATLLLVFAVTFILDSIYEFFIKIVRRKKNEKN